MKSDTKVKIIQGKAIELVERLADSDAFRKQFEEDPRQALEDYVVNIDEVPSGPVQLPESDEIHAKTEAILNQWRSDGFVGHWPFTWAHFDK